MFDLTKTRLWSFLFLLIYLVVYAPVTRAQGGIPIEQLAALKAATVLVMTETADEEGSGSGFLISKDKDYGYIATNEHVIAAERAQRRRVAVVFNSGMAGKEIVLAAEVVAEDPYRDLAILRVRSGALPEPLKLSSPQAPRETAPIWVLGFPFGEMLATGKMHPSITITTGTITSLRLNEFGKVMRVQVDADINEGNSGGPIVDATGGLVGIATEKIEDTKIGLGLPPSELDEMLRGRVKEAGFHPVSNQDGNAEYRAAVVLIDPMRQVRSVSVFLIPASLAGKPEPNVDGKFEQLSPAMTEFPLKPGPNEFSGLVLLENPEMADQMFLQQIRLELADGKFKWTQPARLQVPFSRGRTGLPAPATVPGGSVKPGAKPGDGGDDWLGAAAVTAPNTQNAKGAPAPASSNRLLLQEARDDAGATFRLVDLPVKPSGSAISQWSTDGKILYFLERTGTLHKISLPEFREEKVLTMGQQTDHMILTRSGLAIGLPLLQEIWLVDPNTLRILKRVTVGGLSNLAGSPKLKVVYAIQEIDVLSLVDLETGTVKKQLKAKAISRVGVTPYGDVGDFQFATVTPDGEYFLCGSRNINRLRIEGDELIYEEAGPYIGQNPRRIDVSGDSRYVAMPSGGGNSNAPGHPQVGPYATYVYKITDLKTPVITIQSGAYPSMLAFDKVAGLVYAQNHDIPLIAFAPSGLKQKSYGLGAQGESVQQFLSHPSGHKILILTDKALIWVELPAATSIANRPTSPGRTMTTTNRVG